MAADSQPANGPGGENGAAPAVAPVIKVPDLPPGVYPPNQFDFYRGNNPPGASPLRQIGFYLNLFLFIPILGLLFLWARTTQWVSEDAKGLKMVVAFWNPLVLFCGALGFIAVLLVSNSLGGLFY